MFWCEMKYVFVRKVRQKLATISFPPQFFRVTGKIAPFRDDLTNIQAPMRIQIIQHPIVTLHVRKLRLEVLSFGSPPVMFVRALLLGTEIPR